MATHSSVLTWRIPGTEEPGRRPSMGSHRVRHEWSDLAAAAAAALGCTGFSSCGLSLTVNGSQALEQGLSGCGIWSLSLKPVGSSWIKDPTHVSCIGRWILYHWATREASVYTECVSPSFVSCLLDSQGSSTRSSLASAPFSRAILFCHTTGHSWTPLAPSLCLLAFFPAGHIPVLSPFCSLSHQAPLSRSQKPSLSALLFTLPTPVAVACLSSAPASPAHTPVTGLGCPH